MNEAERRVRIGQLPRRVFYCSHGHAVKTHSALLWLFPAVVLLALTVVFAEPAHATFPGSNGKIAFSRGADVWTMNADGSGQTNLTPAGGDDDHPSWSPDGAHIAFDFNDCIDADCCGGGGPNACYRIKTIVSDGTDERTFAVGGAIDPAWSPSGSRVVYGFTDGSIHAFDFPSGGNQQVLWEPPLFYFGPDWSPDGTEIAWCESDLADHTYVDVGNIATRAVQRLVTMIDPNPSCRGLSWSPDGHRLAFSSPAGVESINRNGTGRSLIATGSDPAWSPDGSMIAFIKSSDLWVMNPDGSGQRYVASAVTHPDWQSIAIDSYPRPKGASPLYVPLVSAFAACSGPTGVHAPPLTFPSCAAQQVSSQVTIGTPDANGRTANSTGSVRLTAIADITATPADEADVTIGITLTDVRRQSDLSDYGGELRMSATLRATDKLNNPSPAAGGRGAATVQDVGFGPAIPCSPTADPAVGSTCSIFTTVDTLIPGTVLGGARSVWQLGQVSVNDGGPDSDGDTAADNSGFMTQGVFAP